MSQPTGFPPPTASTHSARALCARTWWVFLIGGIASVAFGLLAFFNPGIALLTLASFFAASMLVDGAFNAWGALQHRDKDGWWLMLLLGLASAAVGAYALWHPPVSMGAFVFLVAFAALWFGAALIALGIKVRQTTDKEWLLYLGGALSLLFGLTSLLMPGVGGLSIVLTVAFWAVALGVLRIAFALRMRRLGTTTAPVASTGP